MDATAELRSEHNGVKSMLSILEGMGHRIRAGGRVGVRDIEDTVEFLKVFVDQCHHGKEEDVLFPAMLADLPDTRRVIEALMEQHVAGRQLVASIDEAGGRHAAGDEQADGELLEAIDGYTHLLRAHIVTEEPECFDPADRGLSADVQRHLAEEYDRIEREVIGGGRHEAFHATLDRLSSEYVRAGAKA